jgi:hypothetical protein
MVTVKPDVAGCLIIPLPRLLRMFPFLFNCRQPPLFGQLVPKIRPVFLQAGIKKEAKD